MKSQLLIGAASSGSGKTTFTMGLLRALARRGQKVQPFKCGPDYIDTQFHTLAAGNASVNLDTWMTNHNHVQYIYNKYGDAADVCVAEGVMGLFDGYRKMQGSSAEMAQLLNIPVVLLVNARSVAYSVAPLIYGFKHFHAGVRIMGVVFNQVSSASHFSYLKAACTDAGVECLGYLPNVDGLKIPSRHLGLTLQLKKEMDAVIEQSAQLIEKYVDVDKLLKLSLRSFPCAYSLPYTSETEWEDMKTTRRLRIAVAQDAAFNFTYRENLDKLSEVGNLTYFSPLHSKELPQADMVYLPGGYPELFARQLSRNKLMLSAIKEFAENGGKILAECGGMMYLGKSILTKEGGTAYPMAGVLPIECTMVGAKLHLGYRRVLYNGMELFGHEFHYSSISNKYNQPSVAKIFSTKGTETDTQLFRYKNVIAGYTHLYWGDKDIMVLWK